MRTMRGARSRNPASMRRVHRSGGSNTCESDDRISIERPRSPERRDHVAREELEASRLELRRNAAAGVELGDDSIQTELVAQLPQPLDHAGRGAEGHLALQHVVIREARHALGLEAAAVGRSRARATDGRAGELRLALEERRETLPRLFDRTLVGRRDVDRNAEIHAWYAGMPGVAPPLAIGPELRLQIRDLGRT